MMHVSGHSSLAQLQEYLEEVEQERNGRQRDGQAGRVRDQNGNSE